MRLGIGLNRGRVGCPQDNGAHERMHKDMKKELQAERADTQAEMDEWVDEFNNLRPHQALNGETPSQHYRRSPRKYMGSLVEALRGERVGMKSLGKGRYEVWFCEYLLGIVDEGAGTFAPELKKGDKPRVVKARRKQKAVIREFG